MEILDIPCSAKPHSACSYDLTEIAGRNSRKVGFSASSNDRPAEAKFPTVRYLAAPWTGYRFETSSLPVAGLDCTG
jgi:hypothetical protein